MSEVFNPLDKVNLGRIIGDELIRQPLTNMPPDKFSGSGIYAIYYSGPHRLYEELVLNFMKGNEIPIYVGKAIPEGGRKGVLNSDSLSGMSLFKRLSDHHSSICDVANLKIEDFQFRKLLVDDIWIPLGETVLIQKFHPFWNVLIDGFGNHAPGKGRKDQKRSVWDVLHPGRKWAEKLPSPNVDEVELKKRLSERIAHILK